MKLYHTNDIHSEFNNCAKLATFLKHHKTADDLYLDCGDFCDLKDVSIVGTDGVAGSTLLHALQCDGFCVGNNEADLGKSAITKIGAQFNLLSCNLKQSDDLDVENLKSSYLITKQGIRFLIIGISPYYRENMQPNGYNLFLELDGLKVVEPVERIRAEIKKYESQYDCCILLSHSGFVVDKELAQMLPEVALILGGHSHTLLSEPLLINDTLLLQCGEYAKWIGCLEFEVNNFKLCNVHYQLFTNNFEQDVEFLNVWDDCRNVALEELNKPLIEHCDLHHDAFGECSLMKYVCDCLAHEDDCDFAMTFNGIMNHSLLGAISKMSLIECSPSKLNPTKVVITGKQLKDAIELSRDETYIHQSGKGPGFRGSVLGTLSFSHHVKVEDSIIRINGVALKENQEYVVIMDDYLQRGTSYPSLQTPDKDAKFYKGFIRDCVAINMVEYGVSL